MGVALPNVRVINGSTYFYYKVKGRPKYHRLPDVTDPKFPTALQKARQKRAAATASTNGIAKGSFAALIAEYRQSPEYKKLVPNTREAYERYLADIERRVGGRMVSDITVPRIVKLRNEMQSTPGKANVWLALMRNLLSQGTLLGYCDRNAASEVSMLPIGEHTPWPQDVLDAVLDKSSPILRLAVQTALYSGQRISDLIRFTHKMLEGDTVHLRQAKRRSHGQRFVDVYIPVHPAWREAIAVVPSRCDTILYNRFGKPFTDTANLQERLRLLMKDLGYVDGTGTTLYSFHGLRKNSTNYLAEMGLTPHEIGAINGMTIDTVILYTRGVTKSRLAETARDRMLSSDPTKRGDKGVKVAK